MAKVNIQLLSYSSQHPVSGIKKRFRSGIVLWSKPFPFHNTPKSLHNVQMGRIGRNVEQKGHQLFARKKSIPEDFLVRNDRNNWGDDSIDIDFSSLNMDDVMKILNMMLNECYRKLLIHRYLEEKTNEETAMLLSLSMANFYNVHLRGKAQFCTALKREGLI